MPFCKFHNGNSIRKITRKPFEIFSQNLVQYKPLSDDMQRTRTITPPNYRIIPLGNRVRSITLKPFSWNLVEI